ncbi:MAG: homoserine dehydrogenase [Polyangiaceae bacterium]|jgi:homoserine dehydrogenase
MVTRALSGDPLRIGLLGCGTVGGGVVQLLHANGDYLAARVGARLEVARVLVRDVEKDRVPELDRARVTTDPEAVLADPSINLFVEVMGGVDPARGYVERAIDSGRPVVTANKMLLALHGPELVDRAIARGVDLAFEGSVGGGIPVIRVLREAFASDWVTSLVGIVNGTCNYVLTRMRENGLSFDAAVKEAQAKGYAEADPSLDVDGHDAAHKLVVLAMLAFGARVEAARVPTEGIRGIDPIDHDFADRFGYAVKHLVIGVDKGETIQLRVHPALVKKTSTIANVGGVLNAIALEGRALGPCLLSGRGAGDMPTAVSVVADVLDVARALRSGVPGLATRAIQLEARPLAPLDEVEARYYLRFQVFDRPGVLARITGALGDARVSIEQMVQQGGGDSSGAAVQVVILTHVAEERAVAIALGTIATHDYVAAPTRMLRVQE